MTFAPARPLILALVAAATPACAQAPASAARDDAVRPALCRLGFTPVPMTTLASGHHVVAVTVAGKPATFVVDTGAGASVVHAPVAEALGLKPATGIQTVTAVGAGGGVAVRALAPAPVSIAGNPLGEVRLFSTDLAGVLAALRQIGRTEVQGIIGQDLLRQRHAIVDVRQSALYIRDGNGAGC